MCTAKDELPHLAFVGTSRIFSSTTDVSSVINNIAGCMNLWLQRRCMLWRDVRWGADEMIWPMQ